MGFLRYDTHVIEIPSSKWGSGAPSKYSVDLGELTRIRGGRAGHITYLRWRGNIDYDPTAVPNSGGSLQDTVLARALENIRLSIGGHTFIPGLNGHDLRLAEFMNTGNLTRLHPNGVISVAQAAQNIPFDILFHLEKTASSYNRVRYDRCLPVKMFNSLRPGQDELSWSISPNCGVDGMVVNSIDNLRLEIGVVYLDDLYEPQHWALHEYHSNEVEFSFIPRGGIEWAVLDSATWADGAIGAFDHTAYVVERLRLDEETVFINRTAKEIGLHNQPVRWENPLVDGADSYIGGDASNGYGSVSDLIAAGSFSAPQLIPLIVSPLVDGRATKLPRGEVRLKIATRPAAFDTNRVLYMETGDKRGREAFNTTWAKRMGAPLPGGNVTRIPRAADGGNGGPLSHLLPHALYWPGMEEAVINARGERARAEGRA